jgi:hypothetical protein
VDRGRDEGRISEKIAPPEVTVATNMKRDSVTVPEAGSDTQSTLLTDISAFGGFNMSFYFQIKNI